MVVRRYRNALARPNAGARIRQVLQLAGQPSIEHAARELGVKLTTLQRQVRHLETDVGTVPGQGAASR